MERQRFAQKIDLDWEAGEDDALNVPLRKMIGVLQQKLDSIPENERDAAVFCVNAYGDYAHVYFEIDWARDETDAEMESRRAHDERVAENARKAAVRKAEQAAINERAEYTRLKAKFEGST